MTQLKHQATHILSSEMMNKLHVYLCICNYSTICHTTSNMFTTIRDSSHQISFHHVGPNYFADSSWPTLLHRVLSSSTVAKLWAENLERTTINRNEWTPAQLPNWHTVHGRNPAITTWDVTKTQLVNNGINYQPQLVQNFWTINSRNFTAQKIAPGLKMAQLPCIGLSKPCINLPFGGRLAMYKLTIG